MPPRIPDEKRAAILADIRAAQKSCRGIGRAHNVSDATVRKIAAEAGITDAFSRAQTENATRAAVIDNKARRVQLAADLLADAQRLRERAWSQHQQYERGQDGPELVFLPAPPPRDVQALYTSIGIAMQRHIELEKFDQADGSEAATSLLDAVAQGIEAAYKASLPTKDQEGT